jgi:hypothetical protein
MAEFKFTRSVLSIFFMCILKGLELAASAGGQVSESGLEKDCRGLGRHLTDSTIGGSQKPLR